MFVKGVGSRTHVEKVSVYISRDLVALRVLRGLNALRGDVETLGESYVSVEMANEARQSYRRGP